MEMDEKEVKKVEICNFIIGGAIDYSGFACTKCGKVIEWNGVHGICCGIKYGIKRK